MAPAPKQPVKYISERRVGKSHAYNTALAAAVGEVLLFIDDDVRVPDNWIKRGCAAQSSSGGADAVAGGVVFPADIDHKLKTSLLNRARMGRLYSRTRPGWCRRVVGANMAFHGACSPRFRGSMLNWGG